MVQHTDRFFQQAMNISVVKILVIFVIQQSGAFYLIGTFRYQDIMFFMNGEHGCRFIPWNISSNIKSENSITGELCIVFMTPQYHSISALSQISNIQIKYGANQNNLKIVQSRCPSHRELQNVELILICEGKTVLGDNCQLHEQCEGTPNAGICMVDPLDNTTSICQCNYGFMAYNDRCLQVNKMLYEECKIDEQCNGTSTERALICTEIHSRKLCMCDSEYVVDDTHLKCYKGKKEINTECRINEQCTGTENANTCFKEGKGENEKGLCTCNDQYDWIDGKCLKIGMKVFEPCVNKKQCNGTENTGNCTEIGNSSLCFCQYEYLYFQGRCIKSNRGLDEVCEANIQCNGAKYAGVCGENQTCTCNEGFIRLEEKCLPAKEQFHCSSGKENKLLLISVGGGLFGLISCSITIFLFVFKRRILKSTRLQIQNSSHLPVRSVRYSVAENAVFGNIYYADGDQAENIYDEAHHTEEDEETGNVYSSSEPQSFPREQGYDNDTYSHLHQRPLQTSSDVYGVPKSSSFPFPLKNLEDTF